MIIHFVRDEKIIDQIIDNFEKVHPGQNLFLLFRHEQELGNFTYIKQKEKVKEYLFRKEDINTLIESTDNAKGVILHSLDTEFAEVLLNIRKRVKIYWVMWGFDIYSLPRIEPGLFGKETLAFLKRENRMLKYSWLIKQHDLFRKVIYKAAGRRDPYGTLYKAHNRIDACVSFIYEDYNVLNAAYPGSGNGSRGFRYSTILSLDQYVGKDFMNETVSGANVMIGNSNSAECNHLDVFKYLLPHIVKGERKIYVPLSYGKNKRYRQEVLRTGERLFQDSFMPLVDFMPKDDYIKILLSCSVGIFYHYRQQAMGNIIAMLWMGARIYLSEKNPVSAYFKRIGVHVYTLEQDFDRYKFAALQRELVEENRSALLKEFDQQKVEQDYKTLVVSLYN